MFRMRALHVFVLAIGGLAAPPVCAQQPAFHDPQQALLGEANQAEIVSAFPAYDAPRIWAALERIEARAGKAEANALDGYAAATGYLELLVIQRWFERNDKEHLPQVLRDNGREALVEKGLAAAEAFRAKNPTHSDIERVRGELISFLISGPVSGFRKGPEAQAAVLDGEKKDEGNAWCVFASARMHFHNPAMAGGDKDLALKELREISPHMKHFRVSHYLALVYQAKGMLPQAQYWARVAARQAPENPEIARLVATIDEAVKESE